MSTELYTQDFCELIKQGHFEKLDIENLVEEM